MCAVLAGIWRLGWPYFRSEERWAARLLLLAVLGLRLAQVGIMVLLNYWHGAFFNALQDKDWDGFVRLLLVSYRTGDGLHPGYLVLVTSLVATEILSRYAIRWLQIRWRRWLTARLLDDWLARRAYYRMSLATSGSGSLGLDNPDQRIAEDVRDFTVSACDLGVGLFGQTVTLASFLGILWSLSGTVRALGWAIPGYLVWVALAYAALGTWLTHLVGRQLVGLDVGQQRLEADFRYALVRVRENVEAIAMLRGEASETASLGGRFARIVQNWFARMNRNLRLETVVGYYSHFGGIFPFVIAAPRFFSGALTLGGLTRAASAFGSVQGALSWFVNSYADLAEWRAVVWRLTTFQDAIAAAHGPGGFSSVDAPAPGLSGATIGLPDGTALVSGADLALRAGESVVVTGRAGSGKSTLFRTLAGLWPFGGGTVRAAPCAMFLPQRAYLPLGTLRHAVTYPAMPGTFSSAEIEDALTAAGLAALIPHLDADENWQRRLSGGEQQRVALARALLARPDWLFLDEATANLDPDAEARIYAVLRERLPATTIVSIAHRPSVAALHDRRVTLDRPDEAPGRLVDDRRRAAE